MNRAKYFGISMIAAVIVGTVFVYYLYAEDMMWLSRGNEVMVKPEGMAKPSATSERSATVSYEVPGEKIDHLRFVVTLDAEGMIQKIATLDAETNEIPAKKVEFNDQVNVLLKGKKLADLSNIDKVGTSSLTTEAFNDALKDLKAGL